MDELAGLVSSVNTNNVFDTHRKFAIPNTRYNHNVPLSGFGLSCSNSDEAKNAKMFTPDIC